MLEDRYSDFRAGMAQKETDPKISGLRRASQNNRKDWSGWDNPSSPSKKKIVEVVLPVAPPSQSHDQL
jgi:hypothetical protein